MPDPHAAALASLEAPTMVSAGTGAPVMAIVEHASHNECRMRSVSVFDIGERLEFSLSVPGAPPIGTLSGTVISRKQNGARYAYVLTIRTSPSQAEGIARAAEVAHERSQVRAPDVPTENGLTRTSVRIPVDFELRYAQPGSAARVARATNISTGGVLMNCSDILPVGASLELEIPLGSQTVTVNGRIVAHQQQSPNYNVAFYDITDEARDTIARFIESHSQAA
jgi:PilZ domain